MDSCRTWGCGWRREHFVSGHFCIRVCHFWKKLQFFHSPPSPVLRLLWLPVYTSLFWIHRESQQNRGVFCILTGYCAWQSCGTLLCQGVLHLWSAGCVRSKLVKTWILEAEGFRLVTGSRFCPSPAASSEPNSAPVRKANPHFVISGYWE